MRERGRKGGREREKDRERERERESQIVWVCHRRHLGELMFGSLHCSHAIHCTSRDYSWTVYLVCVMDGVGSYIENCVFAIIT